jgi:hypothetical protein
MSGPFPLRQGATHKVIIGPVVAVGDGFTPITTLALTTADEAEALVHDSVTVVDISGYTWAAVTTADGYYALTLQSDITGTVGHMTVLINDDSLCLPVRADFVVMDTGIYDSIYADAAVGLATTAALATAQTAVDGIQTDLSNGTDGLGALKALIDAAQAVLDSVTARIPTALVGGRIDATIDATGFEDAAVDKIFEEARSDHETQGTYGEALALILSGTVDDTVLTPTTTNFETSSITNTVADHYKGRTVIFISGDGKYQATDVTAYALSAGGRGSFTVTAMPVAPVNGDKFVIV